MAILHTSFLRHPPSTIRLMPVKNYLFDSNHSIHPLLCHIKIYVEMYPPFYLKYE